ncbi:hypothetical protein YC2023_041777 [Brassica napus]
MEKTVCRKSNSTISALISVFTGSISVGSQVNDRFSYITFWNGSGKKLETD